MQETGPTVYSPYPRRLQSLTICWCNYKGSTLSSVFLRPWVLVLSELNSQCSTNWATSVRCTNCLPYAKTSLLPKLWEGFIHPHMDRINKFFARLVRTGGTLYLWLLNRLYRLSYLVGKSSLSLFLTIPSWMSGLIQVTQNKHRSFGETLCFM